MKHMSRQPEWSSYACTGSVGDVSCSQFDTVHHIAHVPQAQRIIQDGQIAAGLVYDKSRLNASRLAVSWLSANHWAHGSIYGNVEFGFHWPEVVASRHVYWVEAITDYNPAAYRFLLSTRRLNASKLVQPYDPANDNGPLRYVDGKWFANLSFTSEFLVEDDLPMHACRRIDFVQHHPSVCKDYGSQCEYKIWPFEARFLVLANVVANSIHSVDNLLWSDGTRPNHVDEFVSYFEGIFTADVDFNGVVRKRRDSDSLLLGVLSLCGSLQRAEGLELLSLFKKEASVRRALRQVVAAHFDLDSYEPKKLVRLAASLAVLAPLVRDRSSSPKERQS